MSNNNTVPSISIQIDNESRNQVLRHSLQPQAKAPVPGNPVRRHRSLDKLRPSSNNIRKPSVPVIPETEKSDDDVEPNHNQINSNQNQHQNQSSMSVPVIDSNRISFTKKARKVSNISRTSKSSIQTQLNSERGFINYSYDQNSQSSMHGSMSSLPVIREQYCCCSRWTKLERNLALIVAVLAIIIICLVIAVGVVAKQDSRENLGYLSVFKF